MKFQSVQIFFQENAFENVVCEISAILFPLARYDKPLFQLAPASLSLTRLFNSLLAQLRRQAAWPLKNDGNSHWSCESIMHYLSSIIQCRWGIHNLKLDPPIIQVTAPSNWPNSQIPQCTCTTSHNASFRTEMCAFLFYMMHCGIWYRCIMGFVN